MDSAKIERFIQHVRSEATRTEFVHHKWFVKWHLEVVEKMALELAGFYPDADTDFIRLLVWLHDYGKILDFDNQYSLTLTAGKDTLVGIGFSEELAQKAVNAIETLDKKDEKELKTADIEVRIVSSADGCSHMVGPFFHLWWQENASKSHEELMADNMRKLTTDWEKKIVLPEARRSFEIRHSVLVEQAGKMPEKFFS